MSITQVLNKDFSKNKPKMAMDIHANFDAFPMDYIVKTFRLKYGVYEEFILPFLSIKHIKIQLN